MVRAAAGLPGPASSDREPVLPAAVRRMTRGARTLTSGTCIAVTAADGSAELGITRTARSIGGRPVWPAPDPIYRGFTMTTRKRRTPGHQITKIGLGSWCTCGHYLGGLGFEDGRVPSVTRRAYDLHRVLLLAASHA